jgi:hypothetical protein
VKRDRVVSNLASRGKECDDGYTFCNSGIAQSPVQLAIEETAPLPFSGSLSWLTVPANSLPNTGSAVKPL